MPAFTKAGKASPNALIALRPAGFPLIVLSHGNGGSALMLEWMETHLAEARFVAAVTNHPGNNALEPYTFWWERATGISEVLTAMLADSQFVGRIDPSRVGAAGFHSVGSL